MLLLGANMPLASSVRPQRLVLRPCVFGSDSLLRPSPILAWPPHIASSTLPAVDPPPHPAASPPAPVPPPPRSVMFGSLINGAARNPNIAKQLVGYALLGFALTESIALFSLLVVFLILFA